MTENQSSLPLQTDPASDTLEAELDDWDADSAVGASINGSTASMTSSILRFREENGRTYHSYKEGKYNFPNDERESDRLDLQHHILGLTFNGRLYNAQFPKDFPLHRVLDVGTGTGIWAIDFADQHAESQVLGVDLSPIQPEYAPPNVTFQIDDLEELWTFHQKFDFIHCRLMVGSFADFPKFFQQAFDNLNPGGWIELTDVAFPIQCDDDSLPADSALRKWSALGLKATTAIGRAADDALHYTAQVEAAGFVKIKQKIYKWPSNRWPKDKRVKELGMWCEENSLLGLEALSMALFTRVLGWKREEVDVFLTDVRKDIKNTKYHGYWNIYNVIAQKPELPQEA